MATEIAEGITVDQVRACLRFAAKLVHGQKHVTPAASQATAATGR